MKKIIIPLLLLSFLNNYGQTQFGYVVSINSSIIESDDLLNIKSGTGFGIGVSALSSIHNSADFIVEATFTKKSISINGYRDFSFNNVEYDNSTKYNIDNINVSFLYNQYLIVPNLNKFNVAIQGGLGISLSTGEWRSKENEFIKSIEPEPLSTFLSAGISGGTEQFRITLNYNKAFGNYLNGVFEDDVPDANNSYESREFNAKHYYFSISLTYYTDLFK